MRSFRRTSRLLSVFGAVLLVLYFALPSAPELLERVYARGFYPLLAALVIPLTDAVPFSLAAVLLALFALGWLAAFAGLLRVRAWGRAFWLTFGAAVLFSSWFLVFWGANYRRLSVEAQFGLLEQAATREDLEGLLEHLLAVIRPSAGLERDEARAFAALRDALVALVQETTGVRPTLPEEVKRFPPGLLIRLGSASGVMSPWTLEPHLDAALPEVSRLAIGLHELAHVAGYAAEADADFVSALAGLRAEDAFARYAVALRFFGEGLGQLPQEAQADWLGRLPDIAREDLRRIGEPYLRYRPPDWLGRWQRRIYDGYLKSQGVEAGIRDYSRALTLLSAAQRQGLLPPPGK